MWHGRIHCIPREGFGDRLKVISFAQKLAVMHGIPLSVAWRDQDEECGVTLRRWFDTEFELVAGDHPAPDHRCITIHCDGALVATHRHSEIFANLHQLLRPKVQTPLNLAGKIALHIRAADIYWHEPTRVHDPRLVVRQVAQVTNKPIVLFTNGQKLAELVSSQCEQVICPATDVREDNERATVEDWLSMSTADEVFGTRSNYSATAAAFARKPYTQITDNGDLHRIYPVSNPTLEPREREIKVFS